MKEKESPFEQQQTQFYRNIKIMKIKYYLLTSLFTCLLLNHCSSAVEEKSAPAAEPSQGYPHSASGVSDSEIARKPAREQNQPAKMPLVVRKKYHNKIERKKPMGTSRIIKINSPHHLKMKNTTQSNMIKSMTIHF